jgi:hypothetical protein
MINEDLDELELALASLQGGLQRSQSKPAGKYDFMESALVN